MTSLIIQTASAKVSGKARKFGRYQHVAVIEVEPGVTSVSMISERAKGVRRIVWDSGAVSVGKTARCAYQQALAHAQEIVAKQQTA